MGGWVGERLEDIGKSVEDVIIDPVSDALSSFEDSVRDVVDPVFDGFNDVIENPYVQMVATILDPTPGKIASSTLRAYAKVNSGEELTATDLAQLGISSVAALGDVPIDPDTAKVIKSAAAVADGGDLQDVLVSNFSEEAFNKIAPELQQTARTAFGEDVYNLVQENIDPIQAGFRIASGESPTQVLAETYGDQIVGALGSDDPTVNALGFAGLKTAVGLDQGLDTDEALLAGGEEYYKRGGQLPDINALGTIAGVDLGNINLGDTGFIKDIYSRTIGALPDMPNAPDLAFIEDFIRTNAPDVNIGDLNFEGFRAVDLGFNDLQSLADSGINLRGVDFEGVDLPDFDLDLPDFDLRLGVQQPQMVTGVGQQEETDEGPTVMPGVEQVPIDELLLADLAFKNPLLRS